MDVSRLAELKSKIRKPLLELFGEPRTRGKATDEKCELPAISWAWCSRISEYTNRIDWKASFEVIPDRVHRGLDRGFEERRNLCSIYEKV